MTWAGDLKADELLQHYYEWEQRRQEITRDEENGDATPDEWHESDDFAVWLLHQMAAFVRFHHMK